MKKELPVLSVILYISALITAAAATFMAYYFIPQLIDAIDMGLYSTVNDLPFIVSACMTQFVVYYVYALLLAAAGSAIQHAATACRRADEVKDEIKDELKERLNFSITPNSPQRKESE